MLWYGKEDMDKLDSLPDFNHIMKNDSRVKQMALDLAKKNALFRKAARGALNLRQKMAYEKRTKDIVTDPKVILFSTFDGRSYGDSPKAIYEYMLTDSRFDDYTFIWAFRDPKEYKFLLENKNTYFVQPMTSQYYAACATAKYWLFNYRISDFIYPRKEQVYVQLWHGTPLKRLGYDIAISDNIMNSQTEIREKYKIDAAKFKYILAPSEFAGEKFTSAWNLKAIGKEDTVLVAGYPRNDFLKNYTPADVQAIKDELDLPADKKIILYAPTWRDNQHDSELGYVYEPEADFDKLREALEDEYIILFRAHYLVANSFNFEKYRGFVWDVSGVADINRLYIAADMLITDYSSVFFDYANLGRPMVFYMYDMDAYAGQIRGFYIDTSELPGKIVKTTDDLIAEIKGMDFDAFDFEKAYPAFRPKFNYLDDGAAAKRVAEAVIEEL